MTTSSLVKFTRSSAGGTGSGEPDDGDSGELATKEPGAIDFLAGDSDEVVRLREWGTHRVLPLRAPVDHNKHLDPANTTALQLSSRYIIRDIKSVELAHEGQSWRIKDWTGVANLKQDGVPTREVTLVAGTEVTIAGRTLIAESPRTLGLRSFCSRLLGWSDDRIGAVDQAQRTIRLAGSGRAALVLRGSGDMAPVAFALHQRALGKHAPFLISDPLRRNTPATVRGPGNCANAIAAFRRVFGGTLCVRAERLPLDFKEVLNAFREPDSDVRLLVCSSGSVREAFSMGAAPIDIPPLETRKGELTRIASEYANDAIELLCAPRGCVSLQDLEWVTQLPDLTLSKIEKTLQRIVAIKTSRNISAAAGRLRMAPVSLARWLARREKWSKESMLYVHGLVERR